MTTYFLIPVFNEAQNLDALHQGLSRVLPESEKHYVFVDDCSTDGTVARLKQLFPQNTLTVITKEINAGPGDSFNRGFEWILSHSQSEKDCVVTLEGDNTSDLSILPAMHTLSGMGYELVLSSVYAQGGGFEKTSFFRKFISFFANMLFRAFFNIKVLTLSSFYRVYHISMLKRVKTKYPVLIREKGFICMLEILIKSIKVKASIIEVPMTLKSDLRKGKSKMKIMKNTMSYLRFLMSPIR
jgi:dolichol-phosphate mannosyltransferase